MKPEYKDQVKAGIDAYIELATSTPNPEVLNEEQAADNIKISIEAVKERKLEEERRKNPQPIEPEVSEVASPSFSEDYIETRTPAEYLNEKEGPILPNPSETSTPLSAPENTSAGIAGVAASASESIRSALGLATSSDRKAIGDRAATARRRVGEYRETGEFRASAAPSVPDSKATPVASDAPVVSRSELSSSSKVAAPSPLPSAKGRGGRDHP